jgi:hypothetical protein
VALGETPSERHFLQRWDRKQMLSFSCLLFFLMTQLSKRQNGKQVSVEVGSVVVEERWAIPRSNECKLRLLQIWFTAQFLSFLIFNFIHMCIQCLGHFSPLPQSPIFKNDMNTDSFTLGTIIFLLVRDSPLCPDSGYQCQDSSHSLWTPPYSRESLRNSLTSIVFREILIYEESGMPGNVHIIISGY